MSHRGESGRAIPGLLAALAALALLLASSVQLRATHRRRAVVAAAEQLAALLRTLSVEAQTDGRDRGLLFPSGGGDEPLHTARDGDGDGVRREDVARGEDDRGPLFTLARDQPGVRVGIPDWGALVDLPPSTRVLAADDPAVRFGSARFVVLGADGHATPGSLFVTDGHRAVCGLVVNGATARVRVWCHDRRAGRWRLR